LLRVDEIFGISDENKHKNDAFESYLSAKNTSLKEKIKSSWTKLKATNTSKLSDDQFIDYIQQVDDLIQDVKTAIKASVPSRTLSSTMIDGWYKEFNTYDQALINYKTQLDQLVKNYTTIKNNYDTQILNLQTQINSVKNNILNINQNKLDSYITNIDIQINQLQ
jgi:hypothetical protein